MKVIELIEKYESENPDYYITAAEHTFDCKCMACITFLVCTGLEGLPEAKNWRVYRDIEAGTKLTRAHINDIHQMCEEHL